MSGGSLSDSPVFEWLCDAIDKDGSLVSFAMATSPQGRRLAIRGTVRLALRKAGLSTRSVTREQMIVVLERLLPNELSSRGVDNAGAVCHGMIDLLNKARLEGPRVEDTPEAVFRLLGGGE